MSVIDEMAVEFVEVSGAELQDGQVGVVDQVVRGKVDGRLSFALAQGPVGGSPRSCKKYEQLMHCTKDTNVDRSRQLRTYI